jgi:signal transduction histidine kinase
MQESFESLTLAGVVHDLNNVFETLFEAAELLREDPKYARLAATMERSLKHGARITKSLQARGGITEVERLMAQTKALLEDFLVSSRGPSIALTWELEASLVVSGPRGAWERVLLNLFHNAARMMPQGGEIHVTGRSHDGCVVLEVTDNGPGIPARILPHLFEPGVSTAPKHKGLGLHIVKSIVESVQGTVSAANREEGSGAKFTIQVPLAVLDASPA